MKPTDRLLLEEKTEGARLTLTMSGELDLVTAPMLESAMAGIRAGEIEEVLLNIEEVLFIDSTGLRAILAAKKSCAENRLAFFLTKGTAAARRLFELTGLHEQLPFMESPSQP